MFSKTEKNQGKCCHSYHYFHPAPDKKGVIGDNLGIIFHITPLKYMLLPNIRIDSTRRLEPSCRVSSNEGSQYIFSLRNKTNYRA